MSVADYINIGSWINAGLGLIGTYLVGRPPLRVRRLGWLVSISAMPIGLTIAVLTNTWGFVASNAIFACVCANGFLSAHKISASDKDVVSQ